MSYYSLDNDEFETVKFHIEELHKNNEILERIRNDNANSGKFLGDMKYRLHHYGRDIACSPKQKVWLANLYERYISGTSDRPEYTQDSLDRLDRFNKIDRDRRR